MDYRLAPPTSTAEGTASRPAEKATRLTLKMNDETEIWKPCIGYEGLYEVSDQGRVRNSRGKVLKTQTINSGYKVLHFHKSGSRRTRLVHRLVADAFVPNPHGLPEVNHDDTNKQNNKPGNLEWVTRRGNVLHARSNGLCVEKPNARPVLGLRLSDAHCVEFPSMFDAEVALTGRQSSALNHFFAGKKKSAYGYVWSLL